MLDFIKGNISEIYEGEIVLDNNDIGYLISISQLDISKLSLNEELKIYLRLILREDNISLYGFLNKDSRTLFDLLNTVSSVGPKLSMTILGALGSSQLRSAILSEDANILTKSPGVGKKTANRIILELKDKISKKSFTEDLDLSILDSSDTIDINNDPALEALLSLGYNEYEAKIALRNVDQSQELSEIIRQALKVMAK
ncbi:MULTISPECIES: Holliday junction branch migration protein RuvA [Peptoniphilus]|uniref:Holliday junction branch migration complex subunit RuvA n=1 Tax=Peptoniphilus lacrimalis TaxID=33031 RepID=A0A379C6I6_9FIRM|nr:MULTISPECIES: Holliday junction branch migration protein RuvA [Peptoniphilus]EFK39798.1 Holliday junction DNA helicase RuvA [Peptoniphilus sp. oral taxon 836 str. F0141]SUB57207.1 Holliday junction ATP-dependent DNA helicase RuvA [Peptoniphilus lacrimalis]